MKKRLLKLKIFLYNHFQSKKYLKNSNFFNIKPLNIFEWHYDTFYYKGLKDSKVFFIKISLDSKKIEREVRNNRLISEFLSSKHFVEMIGFNISKKRSFIQYEFVENNSKLTSENFKKYHKEIFNIIKIINKNGYIHRDIRPENFLVGNDFIKIIDFEFLASLKHDIFLELDLTQIKNIHKLMNCGSDFKKSNLVWNDFYSFVEISKRLKQEHIVNYLNLDKYLVKSNYTILNESFKL